MRRSIIRSIVLLLLGASVAAGAQGYKRHFHIHQVSLEGFVVTCDNGGDPTVVGATVKGANALQVSCGK